MNHVHGTAIHGNPAADQLSSVDVGPLDPVTVALDILRLRFPGVCLWYGKSTRHWWAYRNGRLIETKTPEELAHRIQMSDPRT